MLTHSVGGSCSIFLRKMVIINDKLLKFSLPFFVGGMEKGTLISRESPRHPERMMTLRHSAEVEHLNRTESGNKVHSKGSAMEGKTPPTHHTPLEATGTICVACNTCNASGQVDVLYFETTSRIIAALK